MKKLFSFLFVTICITCTIQNTPKHIAKIKGGTSAQIESAPYHVTIYREENYVCGGALITLQHVLTAAHCIIAKVENKSMTITVFASRDELLQEGVSIKAKKVYISEDYGMPELKFHDIGVIKLEKPFKKSSKIQTIKLPTQPTSIGERVTFTGFGMLSTLIPFPSLTLQTYVSKVMNCYDHVPKYVGFYGKGMICVETKNISATKGDSGGPLVDSQNQLIGVLSCGFQCGDGRPDIFTDVYYHLYFIKQIIPSKKKFPFF